jgi:hypothetical protein
MKGNSHMSNNWIFLDHEKIAVVAKMRKDGNLGEAEKILLRAEPTPAVLDEFRKIASKRAQSAKKKSDWAEIIRCLEGYNELANKWRKYCIKMVNQEPPPHTEKDQRLLEEAKVKLKT